MLLAHGAHDGCGGTSGVESAICARHRAAGSARGVEEEEFVVLGSDDAAQRFFASHDLRISSHLDNLSPDTHVVVVWDASRLSRDEKRQSQVA